MPDATSRYANIPQADYTAPDGRVFAYQLRRFPPKSGTFTIQAVVAVKSSDRLDSLTGRTLGNPLLFWQVADANDAMNPFDLLKRASLKIPAIRA